MSKEEAMKLALEALEWCHGGEPCGTAEAITALREALAEQKSGIKQVIELYDSPDQPSQQEPVAWICEGSSSDEKHAIDYWPGDIEDIPIGTKLYTSPTAQRTWVGLTDAEVIKTFNAICNGKPFDVERILELHRAIEAKLREENT